MELVVRQGRLTVYPPLHTPMQAAMPADVTSDLKRRCDCAGGLRSLLLVMAGSEQASWYVLRGGS